MKLRGGADELLFDVYKKIHDEGLDLNMTIGGGSRLVHFTLHGLTMKANIIRRLNVSTGEIILEVSNFWVT